MRFNELEQPVVGDILEVEIGDDLVETVIVEITEDGFVVETDNNTAMPLLESTMTEVAPPGMEDWIKDRKEDFKKRYGDRWEEVLYATAWKQKNNESLEEAEYQGHKVKLGKPQQGDVKKFKVYVRNPATGRTIKVNFGDPDMTIKKSNPKRRKSFRARHRCAAPGPRTKARYWSCRKW